jgi:hypothetical protein
MQLITIAHYGEAQGVIEHFSLTKNGPDLFSHGELALLITGEGPFEASVKTAEQIAKLNPKKVINIGIAGALTQDLQTGDVINVRTIYLLLENKLTYKSFEVGKEGRDLVTSFERLLDPDKARLFRGFGSLVDREAWGVAMASKSAGVPFSCLKIISDQAGTLGACELIKEKASEFSEMILSALLKELLIDRPSSPDALMTLSGFHFTFSMKHRLKSLLEKISLKTGRSEEANFDSKVLDELRQKDISPKQKGLLLLEHLEDQLDPFRGPARIILEKLSSDARGLDLQMDTSLENPSVQFTLSVKNNRELSHKIKLLSKIDLDPFERLMKGDIHVE